MWSNFVPVRIFKMIIFPDQENQADAKSNFFGKSSIFSLAE